MFFFSKKVSFVANGPFGRKKDAWSELWVGSKNVFLLLHNERGQETHETYVNGFFKRGMVGVRMEELL